MLEKLLSLLLVQKVLLHFNSGWYFVIWELRCRAESMLIMSLSEVNWLASLRDWRSSQGVCRLGRVPLRLAKPVKIWESSTIVYYIWLESLTIWNRLKCLGCCRWAVVDEPALGWALPKTSSDWIDLVIRHWHPLVVEEPVCVTWLRGLSRRLHILFKEFGIWSC